MKKHIKSIKHYIKSNHLALINLGLLGWVAWQLHLLSPVILDSHQGLLVIWQLLMQILQAGSVGS